MSETVAAGARSRRPELDSVGECRSDDDSDSSGTSAAAGSEEVQGAFSLLQEFKAIGGGSTAGTEAPATPPPGAAEEPGSGAAAQDAAPAETAEGAEGHAEMQGRVAALAAELEGRLRWLASGKEAAEAALSRVEAAVGLITADHQEEVDRLRQRVAALETAGRVSAAAAGELLENARGCVGWACCVLLWGAGTLQGT